MNGWTILKIIWGVVGFGTAGLILFVVWRARNVIHWNRDIRRELKALADEAGHAAENRRRAIGIIIETCNEISNSLSPGQLINAKRLTAFVHSIAASFFPQVERPELHISLGHLINSLDASLSRFDRILQRPGLKRIRSINIRQINDLYHWASAQGERTWVRWYMAHRRRLAQFMLIRLIVIPDPFSWMLFLSRKLLILVLMKSLLLDGVLFVGRLALDAYDRERVPARQDDSPPLEETLEALARVDAASSSAMVWDPKVAAIRRELVGLSSMLLSNPTINDLHAAVKKAAGTIALRYFPDVDRPLEEAAIGPLLDRTRSLLGTLGRGNELFAVRYIYQTRLDTLIQAKDIGDLVLTPTVRGILKATAATYGWIKWPLKIYRRIKRFSLPGVAVDVGWVLGKKSALVLIYGRTFDLACRELDAVYQRSARLADRPEVASDAIPPPTAADVRRDSPGGDQPPSGDESERPNGD